ncbi:MAG: hypothetical protein K2H22_07375 [Muribaculaceae bacterium]|nr:hypothetical protein [Muribaculaceae bacterium]
MAVGHRRSITGRVLRHGCKGTVMAVARRQASYLQHGGPDAPAGASTGCSSM